MMKNKVRRLRLVLGPDSEPIEGSGGGPANDDLTDMGDMELDELLNTLYDGKPLRDEPPTSRYDRRGGYGASRPNIARFLGDIREYFPNRVVEIVQQDVVNNFGLDVLLEDPELASQIEPSMELVTTIMALRDSLPEDTRETARIVVQALVDDLIKRLTQPFEQAFRKGKIDYEQRNLKPKLKDMNLPKTAIANVESYDEELQTILDIRKKIAYARSDRSTKDLIIVIDRSGSMAASIVYTSIYTALLSMIPSIQTKVLVFDTEIVDMSDLIDDPLEFLFAINLGGGTDITRALRHAESLVRDPSQTAVVLISDLFEGGSEEKMVDQARRMVEAQINLICVTALDDRGRSSYDTKMAEEFNALGVPTFASTPESFPEIMAAALNGKDISHLIIERGNDG